MKRSNPNREIHKDFGRKETGISPTMGNQKPLNLRPERKNKKQKTQTKKKKKTKTKNTNPLAKVGKPLSGVGG